MELKIYLYLILKSVIVILNENLKWLLTTFNSCLLPVLKLKNVNTVLTSRTSLESGDLHEKGRSHDTSV